jgi:hypothetical protein
VDKTRAGRQIWEEEQELMCFCAPTGHTHRPSSGSKRSTGETKVSFLNLTLVIMPSSALHELARLQISYPMIFMVSNPQMAKKTHCGVLEFSADEGVVYLPIWMMNQLFLEDGSEVIMRNVTLQKGKYI